MNRTSRLRAVVFDFDGTLIDSLPLVLAAITHAIEPHGPRPGMDIFAQLGGPPERFLPALLRDLTHLPLALKRLEAFHHQNAHLLRLYAGASALLERLQRENIQTALWTGRDRVSASWLLREHRLEDRFTTTVCGDDLPSHKPDPAGLREIMRRLGVSAEETLFVGDADVDVLGGAACGVDTVLIRHSREVDTLVADQCWRTVLSPEEAFDVVMGRLSKIS